MSITSHEKSFFFCQIMLSLLLLGCQDRSVVTVPLASEPDLARDVSLDLSFEDLHSSRYCTLTITPEGLDSDQAQPHTCQIPLQTMLGCDELARCFCQFQSSNQPADEPLDIEGCVQYLVFPRGAVTLADYCSLAGHQSYPGALVSIVDLLHDRRFPSDIQPPLQDYSILASESCGEVAAFSLWGEEPSWFLSLLDSDEPIPQHNHLLQDYSFAHPELITLEQVEGFTASLGLAELTTEGRSRLAARFEGGVASHELGAHFLIHTATTPFKVGSIVSWVMSSTRPGPVLFVEDLVASQYGELLFMSEYPSDTPMLFDPLILGQFAAVGKLLDAACISTCGCRDQRACRENTCFELPAGCQFDEDCCLGQCSLVGGCH